MVTVEKIIAELKIGGYLDAAEYIERQFATINRTAEFGYMKAFIVEGDFSRMNATAPSSGRSGQRTASITISMWTRRGMMQT